MKLGENTDSQDADGQITETRPVPELSREQIEAAFAKFKGDFYQMPPMVSAIKQGSYDYITKPWNNEKLLVTVNNAIKQRQLMSENFQLRRALKERARDRSR